MTFETKLVVSVLSYNVSKTIGFLLENFKRNATVPSQPLTECSRVAAGQSWFLKDKFIYDPKQPRKLLQKISGLTNPGGRQKLGIDETE